MANLGDEYDNEWDGGEGAGGGAGEDGYFDDAEIVEEAAPVTKTPAAAEPVLSAEDQELLAEIEKSQSKSTGWGKLILVVVVSGALFVAAGTAWWSWDIVLYLVPILLIHEFGHFVTMKGFDYRNVNMFFIPFLGAAVTGQRFKVPAWKKAMVALMGPLPSIFLATGVGIVAIVLGRDEFVYICVIALFINGLNLVPLLPFDGGHVLHALLFCRHYYLDVALRVVTIGALLALVILFGKSGLLVGLTVFLALTIPITIRNGKVAQQLRGEGNLESVTEGDNIPPATAFRIAAALRTRMKTKVATKMMAQFTVQVYEQIYTRPPGILASIGLLFMHGAGLLVAFVACLGLSLAVNDDLRARAQVWMQPPPLYAYECQAFETRGDEYKATRGTRPIIATFASAEKASAAYQVAKADISSQDHLQWFGRSVSVTLEHKSKPKALQAWIDRWEVDADELLVESVYSQVFFSMDATFPDVELAVRVENELRAYFDNWYTYSLHPPWLPDALVRDPGEGAQYKARMSLVELAKITTKATAKDERTVAAQRIGDYDEVKKVSDEITRNAVAEFMATDPDIDTVIVDLFLKIQTEEYDTDTRRQLTERMGGTFVDYNEDEWDNDQEIEEEGGDGSTKDEGSSGDLKIEDGNSNDNAAVEEAAVEDIDDDEKYYALNNDYERFSASGSVVRNMKTVSLRGVHFTVNAEGAKAIADWLCRLGAYDMTYAFYQYDE